MSKEVLRSFMAKNSLTPGGIYPLTKVKWEDVSDTNAPVILSMLQQNLAVIPDNSVILSCVAQYADMLREQFGEIDIATFLN